MSFLRTRKVTVANAIRPVASARLLQVGASFSQRAHSASRYLRGNRFFGQIRGLVCADTVIAVEIA
jgi:hypothetical protein